MCSFAPHLFLPPVARHTSNACRWNHQYRHTARITRHVLTDTSAQVEEQRVSGGVNLEYFHAPIGSLYQGLGNVMLRLEPTGQQAVGNTTVLLNAHYDSTLGSPGALLSGGCLIASLRFRGNVMLRLEPTGQQAVGNTTVLLNAHCDSTLGSPGTLTMTVTSL